MKILFFVAGLIFSPIAMAQMYQLDYHLGKVPVSETEDQIVLHTVPPLKIEILPGGPTWPQLSLDEMGRIYAGRAVINPETALKVIHPKATLVFQHGLEISNARRGFKFRQRGKSCYISLEQLRVDEGTDEMDALKYSRISFSNSANKLIAYVRQSDQYGHTANYLVEKIDLDHCQIGFRQNLGNPDFLVELNHSTKGGWWLTGSIEQTLLQSDDGRSWRNVSLPKGLSSLISAYIANPEEMWLAAILPSDETESPYLLVYSNDGGESWRNVLANDPVLERMPVGWLEGQKRRVLP